MSDKTCDICGGAGPHGLGACRAFLLSRVRHAQRRARYAVAATKPVARSTHLKDQSGVAASDKFMRRRGLGTYGPRETARTLENRTTEPISLDHFLQVVVNGQCLACAAKIRHVRMPNGGKFWVCASDDFKGCGWSIGWNADMGRGQQVKLAA